MQTKPLIQAKKIGFIGLGLIGGSIAKTIKRIFPDVTLIATDQNADAIKIAHLEQTIENELPPAMEEFFSCDILFLCTPVATNISYLKQLKGHLSSHCIVTDVGSVKGDIHQAVSDLGMEHCFIGGHPMTGSEKAGYVNATSYLLENAYYIITPSPQVPKAVVEEFVHFIEALGGIPIEMSAKLHDLSTAGISHLPHVIAASLVNMVQKNDNSAETMKTIAAGGFKDITRIASSSPEMWQHICLSNKAEILDMMERFETEFAFMKKAIEKEDAGALFQYFSDSKDYRDSLTIHSTASSVYELYCDLVDEEGGIATIATLLAHNHVNIKNIGIVHNREFEQGVLHIEFYESAAQKNASRCLRAANYNIYER